ncbi:MAG: 3-phosphoshikimate 1-carboxyvinyltransferase [Bacteroidota bacterium]|nr:3-phosphoshikimate 1-carboxyvinyltransferase [Candidatus Kapabacteria bacterium]MDW8220722.1 3-phosphoshikimate 1-carboxyvinyltransferase [Bacteroidota bacterium]
MKKRRIRCASVYGSVTVPASKSITHRALIIGACAADASGESTVVMNPLRSDDTVLTLQALQAMGYPARVDEHNGDIHKVEWLGKRNVPEGPVHIDIHHSGTSARLLTAVAAVQPIANGGYIQIDGSARMRQRPMHELITALTTLGAVIEHHEGFLPLRVVKPVAELPLETTVAIDASKSSQFLSALLLIAPLLPGGINIRLVSNITSQSYSDMTIAQMAQAQVHVEEHVEHGRVVGYSIDGGQRYCMREYNIEGDYSSASYWLAAATITGGKIHIPNLTPHSLQGDQAIVPILESFGARAAWKNDGLHVQGTAKLQGVEWNMNTCPDIVPTVSVVALFAEGRSVFRNIEHLRYKESDRIQAVCENIERLGGTAYLEGSDLIIQPTTGLHGASLPTFDDHRIAMSFALAGLRISGVEIEQPECVAKSYPNFWHDFEQLCVCSKFPQTL